MDMTADSAKRPPTLAKTAASANATPAANGALDVSVGGMRLQIDECRHTRESASLVRCEGDTHIRLSSDGRETTVMLTSLYIDTEATLYRGPLDGEIRKVHSVILTDVDGDGHDDLIAWTGREGAYGGPSYDVLLFDPTDRQFYGAPAFSELTVGANSLFSIEDGRLKLSSTDGCCTRYFDTYVVEQREPKLVERITEERVETSGAVRTRVERLIDGTLKEVD